MNKKEYLLVCLSEELAEVSQQIGKCLRFGIEHQYEKYSVNNANALRGELSDVEAILQLLEEEGVSLTVMPNRVIEKMQRTEKFMQISITNGQLVNEVTE